MNKQKVEYSVLELAIVSKGDSMKQTLNNSLVLAKQAELFKYKRFWFAEHHNSEHIGSSATSILIGYVAENTTKIRIGSGGIMLPNHSPLIIAEQFGTLGQLFPNRIDLGLGRAPGTDPQTAQAIRSDFMQAAHAFPAEVNKIQTYFSPENKNSKVRAGIAEGVEIPLYILGSSPDSAHLAAGKGLPYAFASHFASTHLLNALEIYRQEFQASQFLEQPYTMAGINVFVADTDEEANKLFTSLISMFIGILTGARDGLQPPVKMTSEHREMIQHPALQKMLKYSFVGSKQTVKKQIKEFIAETEIDELIVVSPTFYFEERLKSYQLFGQLMEELNENT